MKRLPPPDLDAREVYGACVSEIPSSDLAMRFTKAADTLSSLAEQYQSRTTTNELHLYPASEWGNGDQIVISGLTKTQFTDLYSTYLVPSGRSTRIFYDKLLSAAPLGKCPLCGFGQVSTLDHFMPKAYYPYFAVLPINLVPVCADCNKKKSSGKLKEQSQPSHPYFEVPEIDAETWLFATVVETSPATAVFSVATPKSWPEKLTRRIRNHFKSLSLASRFAIEAASEMATLSDYLGMLGTGARIGEHLTMVAHSEQLHFKNSWKAALYEALSRSGWYQDGGYRRT